MDWSPRSPFLGLLEIRRPQDGEDMLKILLKAAGYSIDALSARLFYHLKKVIGNRLCVQEQLLTSFQDIFPWVYFNYYVNNLITLSLCRRTDK